ncbi:MAG: FliA/WhiG family RNA polymerase sigma factor, partial [Anaerolineaceae bacterium]
RSPAIREELVLRHVSLIHYVLGRLGVSSDIGMDYEDLVHQGLLGLIDAVDRYNPGFGTQFSTYATVRIRGKVLDYLRSIDWLSRTARHRSKSIQKAIQTLTTASNVPPNEQQISDYLGIDLDKVHQGLLDSNKIIVSLDALVNNDEDSETSLYDTLADDNQEDPADIASENDLKSRMVGCLKKLSERDQLVLSLYYFEELTLKEIGKVLEVSESRACQIHSQAILNLQAMLS